jgi:hypothetical protein
MGLGLQRLDDDSVAFKGLLWRRMLVATFASFVWYSSASRLHFSPRQITYSLPAVFGFSYFFSKGLVMQYQAFNYNISEYDRKRSENLEGYLRNTRA